MNSRLGSPGRLRRVVVMMLMRVPCRGSMLASLQPLSLQHTGLQAQRLRPLVHLKHSPAAPCRAPHAAPMRNSRARAAEVAFKPCTCGQGG